MSLAARADETIGANFVLLPLVRNDGRLRGIPAPEKMMSAFSAMAVLTMSAKLDMATMTLTPMIPLVFSRALRSSSRRPQMLAVL